MLSLDCWLSPIKPASVTIDLGLLVAELVVDIKLPLLPLLFKVMSPVLTGVWGGGQPRPDCPRTAAAA